MSLQILLIGTRRVIRLFLPFDPPRRPAIIARFGNAHRRPTFLPEDLLMHTPHVLSGGRYPVLRSLAIIYVIAAGLAVLTTILGVAYVLIAANLPWTDRGILAVGVFTAGFFLVLTMLAIAEVLKLVIDIEHNTRVAAAGRNVAATSAVPAGTTSVAADGDGAATAATRPNRLDALDEETAEAALLRGH
jgi:hypothetical protein